MKNIRYHRNCDEISIYSFNKVSEDGDYRHLVKDWDEYEEIEIDEIVCENNWKVIFDEYCRLTDDNKIIMFYEVHQDLMKMKIKQYSIYKLIEVFITVTDDDIMIKFADMFEKFGYPIDLKKGIMPEAQRLTNRMKFYQNAINVKEKEYNDLRGEEGEATPFLQQDVSIEKHTGRNNIDIKKTSAKKWIYIVKSVENGRK